MFSGRKWRVWPVRRGRDGAGDVSDACPGAGCLVAVSGDADHAGGRGRSWVAWGAARDGTCELWPSRRSGARTRTLAAAVTVQMGRAGVVGGAGGRRRGRS